MELLNFDSIFQRMPSLARPMRVVLAGSDSENILAGLFYAYKQGIATPVLVGDRIKTERMMDKLGISDLHYTMIENPEGADVVQTSIDLINSGGGDVLMRGNTQTREFLMPIIDRRNGLRTDKYMSHVSLAALPEYHKLIALSDMTVIINPDVNQKKGIIRNTVETLKNFGYERPKVALMALVEKPTFHMMDTIDAYELATLHKCKPIADCELVGPIAYDMILDKESARLKNYDCPLCGDFDAIIAPNLMAGNVLVKSWQIHANVTTCGAVVGARIPVALTSRSVGKNEAFMSLAFCGWLLQQK